VEKEEFETLPGLPETCSCQLNAFMAYLERDSDRRQIRE
jgi:hypothetical protein